MNTTNNNNSQGQKPKGSGKSRGLANLKPFKKGQSGNPAGMKKGYKHLKTVTREILGTVIVRRNGEDKTYQEEILLKLSEKARAGDTKSAEILFDRADGKAKQSIEHTGEDGEPIKVVTFEAVTSEEFQKKWLKAKKEDEETDKDYKN